MQHIVRTERLISISLIVFEGYEIDRTSFRVKANRRECQDQPILWDQHRQFGFVRTHRTTRRSLRHRYDDS